MSTKKIGLTSLNVVDYNPRIIGSEELENLKASIKEHTDTIPEDERGEGFRLTSTITVNRQGNRIIGGHQRIKALKNLGQDWIHPDDITWVEVEPNSAKEKALNVSLNNDKAAGSWDRTKLDAILKSIKVDMPVISENLGFDEIQLEMPQIDSGEISQIPTTELSGDSSGSSDDEKVQGPPKLDIQGVDDRAGRFLLTYTTDEEKSFWMKRLGIKGDKVVYVPSDVDEVNR